MDANLDQMSRGQLIDEVRKLRKGIRAHRDSKLHELCWRHSGLGACCRKGTDPLPVVPEWPQFLRGCVKYRESLDAQAPGAPRSDEHYKA